MDIVIAPELLARRRRKRIYLSIAFLIALFALVWLTRVFAKGKISRSEISTARVEIGDVENTITATGEVLPMFEEIFSSTMPVKLKAVMVEAGSLVQRGQVILEIDKYGIQNEQNSLKFQLQSKKNLLSKLRLEFEKKLTDLKLKGQIKQLEIRNWQATLEKAKLDIADADNNREAARQAEFKLRVVQLENEQLENEINNMKKLNKIEQDEARISEQIQEHSLAELERKLKLSKFSASHSGVVTYINKNLGAPVKEGEILAKVADVSSFKVKGALSESYINDIYVGMAAVIKVNSSSLRGNVTNIYPTVQNGLIAFDVQIKNGNKNMLRPNLSVDLFLITTSRNKVVRVSNGPAFRGPHDVEVFVVEGNVAKRRKIRTGLSNFDYVEIEEGLKPGETVVTSDISSFRSSGELSIK